MDETTTLVRKGNHFVLLECGWVLLSGPWFDYLSRIEGQKIILPKWHIFHATPWADPPTIVQIELVEWIRVSWHPGVMLDRTKMDYRKRYLYDEMLRQRTKNGFRLSDGRLPAYINHPEWIESEWDCPPEIRTA